MKAEHSPLTPRKLTENLERLTVRCVRLHFLTHHSLTAWHLQISTSAQMTLPRATRTHSARIRPEATPALATRDLRDPGPSVKVWNFWKHVMIVLQLLRD